MSERDVEVALDNDALTIQGAVNAGMYDGLSSLCTEYNVGKYFPQSSLYGSIDSPGIKATMHSGELELILPKVEAVKPRKIEAS